MYRDTVEPRFEESAANAKLSHGDGRGKHSLPVFELARVLVHFNHIASVIVNANHSIV